MPSNLILCGTVQSRDSSIDQDYLDSRYNGSNCPCKLLFCSFHFNLVGFHFNPVSGIGEMK